MHTNLLVLMKTFFSPLDNPLHYRVVAAFSCFILLLLCPLILKLLIYLFPLLFSTAICIIAFYLFMLSEKNATKEILLVDGEKIEHGFVQFYDEEVNYSKYTDHTEACCFLSRPEQCLFKSGWEEDKESVILAGKLHVGINNLGVFGEEVASCVVDRLAEGAWDSYFGKNSKWHYMGNMLGE